MKTKLIIVAIGAISTVAQAQHTLPNSWTGLYGAAQGFPQERSGRAIHAIHTAPTNLQMGSRGKIVFFGRSNVAGGPVRPHTWIPPMAWDIGLNGTFGQSAGDPLDYEAFCCGQTLMEDGKIVITGSNFRPVPSDPNAILVPGPEVATYDPVTNLWTKSSDLFDLNKARYYPTTYRMPDGRITTLGGQATKPPEGSPIIETYVPEPFEINPDTVNVLAVWEMPVANDWDFLNYPVVFAISPTELFVAGNARHLGGNFPFSYKTFYFSVTSDGTRPVDLGGFSETWHGSPVMYRPGLIMNSGGVETLTLPHGHHDDVYATGNGEKIDINIIASRSTWSYIQPMNHTRIDHNSVILPDGRVFAVGGTKRHGKAHRLIESEWVQSGEIWNPDTNTWTMTANLNTSAGGGGGQPPISPIFRGYHSTGLLMPDARVFLAGGDAGFEQGGEVQLPSAHFYLPNYGVGTRPQILSGPDEIEIGSAQNTITMDITGVTKVALVALGAVTHSYDMNQRYMQFDTTGAGTVETFAGPVSTTQAPPGLYMLFALKPDGNGNLLPCKMAKYVKVSAP